MLREAIKAATENMRRLYELSGGVEHDGEKGAFREFFLAQLLRPLMPPHFGVGSGVVVDAYGKQSRQSDVIIYDQRLLPPILLAGDRGIFPIDSVLVVIEVKSQLKASYYQYLVDAAFRLSPLNPDGLRIATPGHLEEGKTIYPLFAVFAYTADSNRDEAERLEEQCPGGRRYVRLIGVLDKGVWRFEEKNDKMVHPNVNSEDTSAKYMISLLNRLEEVAKTRGEYRLQDWLK